VDLQISEDEDDMDKCDNCWKPITDTNPSILCTRCGLDCCQACCPDGVCDECRADDTFFDENDELEEDEGGVDEVEAD
jgi:hypothetical protein